MTLYYALSEEHHPIPVYDTATWANWFKSANRIVKQETVGPCFVSTVFLGLAHNFHPTGRPLLFETMVIVNGEADDQARCCTWEEALLMHESMVEKVRTSCSEGGAQ